MQTRALQVILNNTPLVALDLLLLAKEKGLIAQVSPFIAQLQSAGLYFHPRLVRKVLELAHEASHP